MRIIFLLLISFSSYGQAINLLGFNRQREAGTPDPIEGTETYVDNAVQGTGDNQCNFSGTWAHGNKANCYAGTQSFTNSGTDNGNSADDPYVEVDFTGFQVSVIGELFPNHGIFAVSVDGGAETLIDQYGTETPQLVLWTSPTLTNGPHTIKVRDTHTKNASATDYYIQVDAFKIYSNESTPPITPTPGRWYVATTGNDSNAGTTAGAPFLTIQKAFDVAQPGNVITVAAGTYRETITPPTNGTAGNPITVQAASGATVIVSGLETIANTGWTVYSGNIYQKTVTLPVSANYNSSTGGTNTTLLANQVFKGSTALIQARWPNITTWEEIMDKSDYRTRSQTSTFNNTNITDSGFGALGIATNGLSGGMVVTNGWFLSETRTISANNGSSITYSSGTINSDAYRQFYYITNALELLDAAGEWQYESGVLYVWQPAGGSPTGIEYKARNWGFDLRGKSYINIRGLTFIGCEPGYGNGLTNNVTIENVICTYQNHGLMNPNSSPDYFYNARQVGIYLGGSNNVVKNSEFRYGIQGVWAGGNTRVENNYFKDYGYDGTYGCPVTPLNNSNGVVITQNTMYRTGRSSIHIGSYTSGNTTPHNTQNMDISYNDMSVHTLLLTDNGAIYGNIRQILTGTRIHHNWMHDTGLVRVGAINGVQVTGVYLDQASGPVTMDHNVTWNGDECDFYAEQHTTERSVSHFHYNNTFAGTTDRSYISYSTGITPDVQRNNIYRGAISASQSPNIANSTMNSTNPLFAGGSLSTPAVYFQLQAGSPSRGIGTSIGGINDSDNSPKDAGAYYYGQTAWTAGYVAVSYSPIP